MGKRQIGQLQPFEFVITLAVAELACTPMQDISIPIVYGIIPLFTVFVAHYFITLISTKSVKFRKFLNGKPMIVIDKDGIDSENLKKLNMNVNDLLESIRGQNYFSIQEVSFAVVETNGNMSIIPNTNYSNPTSLPLTLIAEGIVVKANLSISNTNMIDIDNLLANHKLKIKDVLLMTTESNQVFIQPLKAKYILVDLSTKGSK